MMCHTVNHDVANESKRGARLLHLMAYPSSHLKAIQEREAIKHGALKSRIYFISETLREPRGGMMVVSILVRLAECPDTGRNDLLDAITAG